MEQYRRDWSEERKAEYIRREIDISYDHPLSPEERKSEEASLRQFLEHMSDPRVNWNYNKAMRIYGYHFFFKRPSRVVKRSRIRLLFDYVEDLFVDVLMFFDYRIDRMKRRWRQR